MRRSRALTSSRIFGQRSWEEIDSNCRPNGSRGCSGSATFGAGSAVDAFSTTGRVSCRMGACSVSICGGRSAATGAV